MGMHCKRLFLILLAIALAGQTVVADDKTLDISPVYQETAEWCWLAVGQMVLQYFNEPLVNPAGDYQCGIIGLYGGPFSACWQNCYLCPVPAGSTANVVTMLRGYPVAAAQMLHLQPRMPVRVQSVPRALSLADLKTEIDNDRPVIAGINPSGGWAVPGQAQHVVLIIGYDESAGTLTVNDPFPYEAFNVFPYQQLGATELQRGQYEVDYTRFKNGLRWTVSLMGIADPNN